MERRFSKQRSAILSVLAATKEHPDAETVFRAVRSEVPNVSLGTVYRNLGELAREGTILALETGEGRTRYDYDTSPHQHFVCRACGKVSDLRFDLDWAARAAESGAVVEGANVVLYGLCPACARKNLTSDPDRVENTSERT